MAYDLFCYSKIDSEEWLDSLLQAKGYRKYISSEEPLHRVIRKYPVFMKLFSDAKKLFNVNDWTDTDKERHIFRAINKLFGVKEFPDDPKILNSSYVLNKILNIIEDLSGGEVIKPVLLTEDVFKEGGSDAR